MKRLFLALVGALALLTSLAWACIGWNRRRRVDSFEADMRALVEKSFGREG